MDLLYCPLYQEMLISEIFLKKHLGVLQIADVMG